jgi:hypothetical protein
MPRIHFDRLVNGTVLSLGSIKVTIDYHQDPKLEGCLERLKKSRLDMTRLSSRGGFVSILKLVLQLLPGGQTFTSAKKAMLSQISHPLHLAAARNTALKYLADRAGFCARLGPHQELELIDPLTWDIYNLPTEIWTSNIEDSDDWSSRMELSSFFGSLDSMRVAKANFILGERIYKGNTSSIFKCDLMGHERVAKVFMVDLLEPVKLRNCLRELYLTQELCASHNASDGLIKYYGYHFDNGAPRRLIIFMEKAEGVVSEAEAKMTGVLSENEAQSSSQQVNGAQETQEGQEIAVSSSESSAALSRVLHIATSCLLGLATLHQSYVIHRDVKCANLLFIREDHYSWRSRIVLADFGLSKKRSLNKSFTYSSLGSTRWMAPEVLSGSSSDYKSDMWSFGMTLVELLTGQLPYHGTVVLDVPKSIAKKQLPQFNWKHNGPEWDPIKAVLMDCLNWTPSDRPSALDLLQRLTEMRASSTSST